MFGANFVGVVPRASVGGEHARAEMSPIGNKG